MYIKLNFKQTEFKKKRNGCFCDFREIYAFDPTSF